MARSLTHEDKRLWQSVCKTTRALLPRRPADVEVNHRPPARRAASPITPSPLSRSSPSLKAPRQRLHQGSFDRKTITKLGKGRLPLEARIDLHGLTQDKAYHVLLDFVQNSYKCNYRHILVITGKGASAGSTGVLRQSVPRWLTLPPFRVFVRSFVNAALNHGGHGAFYIKLRGRD